MTQELFVRAEEVASELGISKPYAYKLVREMNEELKKKGFLTIPGRVPRQTSCGRRSALCGDISLCGRSQGGQVLSHGPACLSCEYGPFPVGV